LPWRARRCSPPLASFPAPGVYKRTARFPSFSTPASTTPSSLPPSSIEPVPPRPSSAPVSPALPSPLNSSPIIVALELHHVLASTTHPPPSPIAPGSLTGDLLAAGARHLAVDRPSQAPSGQIGPTTVIPYPRPCLATTPPSQNRDPGGEPPRTSPAVGPDRFAPPPRHPLAPSASPSPWHVGPRPRRCPHAVPPLAGQVGRLPTRPRAPALG
jgi:hypothetical protein